MRRHCQRLTTFNVASRPIGGVAASRHLLTTAPRGLTLPSAVLRTRTQQLSAANYTTSAAVGEVLAKQTREEKKAAASDPSIAAQQTVERAQEQRLVPFPPGCIATGIPN
jgi:hypothetical protein